tara:strand:+ start:126 stop:569 length:444 start_codon:yes stop_codon:yes gene_type:complete
MSSNRLIYEKCSENQRDKRNSDQASWIFEELRFNNKTECMADMPDTNAFGKQPKNLVDIETTLFGINNKTNRDCKAPEPLPENTSLATSSCSFFDRSATVENAYELTNKRCAGNNDILDKNDQKSQENIESDNNLQKELLEIENYNM